VHRLGVASFAAYTQRLGSLMADRLSFAPQLSCTCHVHGTTGGVLGVLSRCMAHTGPEMTTVKHGARQQFGAQIQQLQSSPCNAVDCMPLAVMHSRSWADHLDAARRALPAASAVLKRHRPVVAVKLLEAAQAAGRGNPRHHAPVACSRARCTTTLCVLGVDSRLGTHAARHEPSRCTYPDPQAWSVVGVTAQCLYCMV
jgi:hypothetical protein